MFTGWGEIHVIRKHDQSEMFTRLLRQAVRFLRWPAGLIALAGLLLSLAVHVASTRGLDVEVVWPGVWILHVALFPLVVLAAVTAAVAADGQRRLSLREFLALVPLPARIVVGLGLVYVVATFLMLAPLSGAGDPVVKDGRYFFNDHGTIREVTEQQFHFQRSISLRLYSAFWLYIYLFSAVYLLGARQKFDR